MDNERNEHGDMNPGAVKQALSQLFATVNNEFPIGLHGYFSALVTEGFTEDQALSLTHSLQERLMTLMGFRGRS